MVEKGIVSGSLAPSLALVALAAPFLPMRFFGCGANLRMPFAQQETVRGADSRPDQA